MLLTESKQIEFAKEILFLIKGEKDTKKLKALHKITSLLLELAPNEENGIAFYLQEYAYEMWDTAKRGEGVAVWRDVDLEELEKAIVDYQANN